MVHGKCIQNKHTYITSGKGSTCIRNKSYIHDYTKSLLFSGTNTATIRNVKMRASTDSEWVDVDVDLSTRSEEIYEKNPKYTAIAFNIKIPSVDSDCNMEFTRLARVMFIYNLSL